LPAAAAALVDVMARFACNTASRKRCDVDKLDAGVAGDAADGGAAVGLPIGDENDDAAGDVAVIITPDAAVYAEETVNGVVAVAVLASVVAPVDGLAPVGRSEERVRADFKAMALNSDSVCKNCGSNAAPLASAAPPSDPLNKGDVGERGVTAARYRSISAFNPAAGTVAAGEETMDVATDDHGEVAAVDGGAADADMAAGTETEAEAEAVEARIRSKRETLTARLG
jgi:hypothetical protein